MKYTIKNPLNSPYPVISENGQEIVPARGELTSDFSDLQIQPIKAVGYFEVIESGAVNRFVEKTDTSDEPVNKTQENEHVAPRPRGRPRKDA